MEVTESYRVLELEVGAPRAAVDAAYCRLVERWHPDRATSGGDEAVREAQRKVQSINEAYHTLAKISPGSVQPMTPPPAQNPESKGQEPEANAVKPAPPPSSAAPNGGTKPSKPKLPPLVGGQPSLGYSPPPPPPPPPETWAARPASVASASPAQPAPTAAKSFPAPPPTNPLPIVNAPTPAPVQQAAPAPSVVVPASESSTATKASADRPRKVPGLSEMLFPAGSAWRRFAPVILVVVLIVVLLLGKYALSSPRGKTIKPPDPKTTGTLVVRSNRPNTSIEATRLASADSAATASVSGEADQSLSGLPPGKYAVTAHAEGWPEMRKEATVDAEHTTEVTVNFKSGSLRLDSDPAGATVRLGAAVLGKTPLVVLQLPPGDCQLTLQYPFWPDTPFKTTITENTEATGSVRLPHGKLTVETARPGTTVMLGGRTVGQTPLTLDPVPAGINKLILRAKDFPPLKISATVEDRGDVKLHPVLGAVFPVLDPAALLRAVWVRDDPDNLAPPLEGVTGPFQSRNGIVKNINRKWLFEAWLRKSYCFTGIVKSYDRVSGQVEFAEQQSELSKFRVLAFLSAEARNDAELSAQLVKGASFALYGRLSAVEEPHWPSKVITFEFAAADPLR